MSKVAKTEPVASTGTKVTESGAMCKKTKRAFLRLSDRPDQCSHTLFRYLNNNKSTIICTSCGSQKRLYRAQDGGVTASDWVSKSTTPP